MKKIIKKFTKILLLTVMVLSELITPISVFADEINNVAPNKGDAGINNAVSDNDGESITVSTSSSNGNVTVEKTVSKAKDLSGNYINGRYKVEFDITGTDIENPKPVYVVVVFDKSGSMNCVQYRDNPDGTFTCVNRGTKWNDAVKGTKDFAVQLLKEIPTANIALVTFSDTSSATPARGFRNANLNNANFGEADGATNLHAGLKRANALLDGINDENASKYVVVISDGEPTYYLKNNGTIGGDGGETTKEVLDATYEEANKLKNSGTTIFSIGYSLPTGIVYNDRYDSSIPNSEKYGALSAKDILKNVASADTESDIKNGITHYLDSDPTALVSTLKKVAHDIVTVPAGTNATLIDNIGDSFKIVNEDGTLSSNRSYNSGIIKEITKSGTKITFYVEIDPNSEEGWHEVNNGFSLSYTDEKGKVSTIVYGDTENEKDPEVYWNYNFIVNYYKDEISNGNHIGSTNLEVSHGEEIALEDLELLYMPIGYEYNSISPISVTVDKVNNSVQEINVLYTKKKFNYIVNYYFADENNNYNTTADETISINNVEYNTEISTSDHYKEDIDNSIYSLDTNNTKEENYTINNNDVVINIYYKRNSYDYTINYHFNNVIDTDFTKNNNAIFGSIVKAEDNYLEDTDNTKLENKEQNDNTDYFLHPTLDSNKNSITIGAGSNILNLYYISTMIKENTTENMTKTSSIETITSGNAPITYSINYRNTLLNVRKGSVVKVVIEDILPYEIDTTKSNLKTGINNVEGVVSDNNKKITWTFETTVNEFKEELDISKNFNYTVVYKNIAGISSNKDNTLVNTASGTVFVDNRLLGMDRDTATVTVDVKGNLIVKHVEKDNPTNVLAETENYTNLVGTEYSTNYKTDILGYTVDTTSIPSNANGTYSEEDTEVIYYYVRKDGEIEVPTIEKIGPETVENVNSTFEYKITVSSTIKDYVGKVTLKVTDNLPYEIDEENSTLDSSCKYEDGVITCTKEFNVTEEDYTMTEEGERVFNIDEEFTLNLKYKNITSESVINNAKSEIILDKISGESEDETETTVEKGKVTAIYVEEGNESNVLADSETSEGLVGTSYTTEEKEIFGYTLVQTKYPENAEGVYTKEDITVKYVYSKNDGIVDALSTIKEGPTYVTSVDSIFNYTITAGTTIKDYTGKATLKVVDTLPYDVDRNKSTIDEACVYTNDREIVCTKEYNVTEDNFVINETFNLSIVYTEITSGKVVNNVSSIVILDDYESPESTDDAETVVEEGKVTAIYVEEGNEDNKLSSDETSTGLVGSSYTTEEKEIFGYTLVQAKYPENAEGVYTKEDITVKYVYSKNEGTIDKPTVEKIGPQTVENINSTFEYKITASSTIKDYVGKVILKVTDNLPYEIDEENSTLDSSCKYEDGVITCTKEFNVTEEDYTMTEEGERVFNIDEEFTLNIKYKNITSESVINNAKSEIILDKISGESEDETETTVEKGKVTAIYVEEGNESNVLADSETSEGLVGTSYTTEEKEIFGYTLVELPENKEGTYTKEDIIVKYVYSKNEGTIEVPTTVKEGPKYVTSVNSIFNYTLNAGATIKDYVGKATLKVIDTLPYAVDKNKSSIDQRCEYTSEKEITCTVEYDVTENNFVIKESFNLSLIFIEITDKKVINNVKSYVVLEDFKGPETNGSAETLVEEGKVTAIYVEEGNEDNKLSNDETTTGLVGNSYTTESKEIFGYTLVELPENKEGTYTKEDTIVKYVYSKNNGIIERPTVEKTGLESIESVNGLFKYEIKASGTIKDYVGKVTLKVIDILPYEIDEENSTLHNLCKYEDGVITCIKEYDVTENNFVINEIFNLELTYKEITNEKVINNVKSEIILDEISEESEDSTETTVEKGKVTAIYVEEGNEDNKLSNDETTTGLVGNSYTTESKEIFGYTLVELPENKEGTYTKEDTIVKYVYSKNVGTSREELEKVGTTNIDNINSKFDYTIKYNTTIMDYVGEAKLVIKDILPYEIDTEKSKYSSNCKYINGEIVCTYIKEINKEDNTFIIEEEFELYYINVNKKDVLNRVESILTYGKTTKENEDEYTSTVKEGIVIVNYVAKQHGEYINLADSITLTGPIGTTYATDKKEFDKYNFIEVIGKTNGEFTEEQTEVTYVYDLTPLPPQTGVETNPFVLIHYIISAFLLFIIHKTYKTSKNN